MCKSTRMRSTELYAPVYLPENRGSNSTDGATIAIIVIVAVLVVVLIVVLSVQAVQRKNTSDSMPPMVVKSRMAQRPSHVNTRVVTPAAAPPARAPTKDIAHVSKKDNRMAQNARPTRSCYGLSNPQAAQHHIPMYDQPAPMPAMQLHTPPSMPPVAGEMYPIPSQSNVIGGSDWDMMSSQNQGTSANSYFDGNYCMDPGMMTPSTATDIKGLQTFMPYMGGGVGANNSDGPVDPSTGLALFTTGKLVRSQLLGGIGAGSFLRQVQDPLSGSSKIGRFMYPCKGTIQQREDWDVRRQQFNAARLESNDGDPVLFNTSEFAYY